MTSLEASSIAGMSGRSRKAPKHRNGPTYCAAKPDSCVLDVFPFLLLYLGSFTAGRIKRAQRSGSVSIE